MLMFFVMSFWVSPQIDFFSNQDLHGKEKTLSLQNILVSLMGNGVDVSSWGDIRSIDPNVLNAPVQIMPYPLKDEKGRKGFLVGNLPGVGLIFIGTYAPGRIYDNLKLFVPNTRLTNVITFGKKKELLMIESYCPAGTGIANDSVDVWMWNEPHSILRWTGSSSFGFSDQNYDFFLKIKDFSIDTDRNISPNFLLRIEMEGKELSALVLKLKGGSSENTIFLEQSDISGLETLLNYGFCLSNIARGSIPAPFLERLKRNQCD